MNPPATQALPAGDALRLERDPADRLDDLLATPPEGGFSSVLLTVVDVTVPHTIDHLHPAVSLEQAQLRQVPLARLSALAPLCPSVALCSPLALVATGNPDLVREIAASLGAQARAAGVAAVLLPPVELADRREDLADSYGCEPYLAGRIAVALVRGSSGQRSEPGVALLLEAGRALLAGPEADEAAGDYRADRLEPIAEVVRDGGLRALVLNRLPAGPLDRDDLRTELGNDELLLLAASDVPVPDEPERERWQEQLRIDGVVQSGAETTAADWFSDLGERESKRRAARLLKLKLRLGLLDAPPPPLPAVEDNEALETRLALGAAVVLKDDGLLPVSAGSRVLVVSAADLDAQAQARLATSLGQASFPAQLEVVDAAALAADPDDAQERLLAIAEQVDLITLLLEAGETSPLLLSTLASARAPLVVLSLGSKPSPLHGQLAKVPGWLQLFGPRQKSLELLPALLDGTRIASGRLPLDHYEPAFAPGWGGPGSAISYSDFSGPTSADSFSVIVLTLVLSNQVQRTVVEIPQIYLRGRKDTEHPEEDRLLGFTRCVLKAGERLRVRYQLDASLLAAPTDDGQWNVSPGVVSLYLGRARGNVESALDIELTGEARTLPQHQRVSTLTSIEPIGSRQEE